jgi:hypothetical protein
MNIHRSHVALLLATFLTGAIQVRAQVTGDGEPSYFFQYNDVAISRATLDLLYSKLEGDRDDFLACATDFNTDGRFLISGTQTGIQFLSDDAYELDMREAGFDVSVDPGAISISTASRIELKTLHEEWNLGPEEKYLQPYGVYPLFWPLHPYDSVDPIAYIGTHFLPADRKVRDYFDASRRASMNSDHEYKYEPRCSIIDIVAVQVGIKDTVQADLMNTRLGRLGLFPLVSFFYSSERYVGIHLSLQQPLPTSSVVDTPEFRIRKTSPNGAVIEIGSWE